MDEILEKAVSIDDCAVSASQSSGEADLLIEKFQPFLHACVARYASRFGGGQREELHSVAMMAFYESIRNFDIEKGHFFPFANRVVCGRLIDYVRKAGRHEGRTISLDNDGDESAAVQSEVIAEASIRSYDTELRQRLLAEEIEQFKQELAVWGITMDSLSRQSPKHKNLREAYQAAVVKLSLSQDIMHTIHLKRYFPMKAAAEITGLPLKTLERARTFILASLIIRTGDYEYLADYVRWDGR